MKSLETLLRKLGQIPHDKVMHFAGGAILAGLGGLLSPSVSLWLVVAAAVLKEVYDGTLGRKYGHASDPLDALATVLGGLPVWMVLVFRA